MVLHLVGYGLAALTAYFVLSSLFTYINSARRAKQLGALPPPAVPHPWYDPISWQMIQSNIKAFKSGRVPYWLVEREERVSKFYGRHLMTYSSNLLGKNAIFTSDPKNIQAILATQFKDFVLGPVRVRAFHHLLGNGIFTADGAYWEHTRAMIRPSFVRERVSHVDLEERHSANFQKALPVDPSTGWTNKIDLCTLFFRLTIDSSTEFLFGESTNTQIRDLGVSDEEVKKRPEIDFATAFDQAQYLMTKRLRFQHPIMMWFFTEPEYYELCKVCHDFATKNVMRALERKRQGLDNAEKAEKTKDKYVFLDELAEQTQDPIELRDQVLHLLLAGRDTTAGLLSFLWYTLARHPKEFQKLRQAVLDEFGPFNDGNKNGAITFAKLKGLQPLQYALNEALRLYSIVPANGRTAVRDTTLPRGGGPDGQSPVFVRKGQEVGYFITVTHRNKDIWGEDAEEFNPDRWIGRKPGWEFLPFNGGPRICLGQQFALTSASYITVKLLQRFEEIENMDPEPLGQAVTLTNRPARGTQVRLKEAR